MSYPAVAELDSLLHDQPQAPLRPNQVEDYEGELRRVGALAEGKDQEGQARPWIPGDRGLARATVQRIRRTLRDQAPKPIEDAQRRDHVARLTTQVINDVIKPAMLPSTVMRRNPSGAVGAFMRQEMSRPIKQAILTAKRALRALEPENPDPDYCNMERFRPSGERPDGASTFMADAAIPGTFAMTPQAKAHWPLGEPTAPTALSQVKAAETAPATPTKKPKRISTMSPEQRSLQRQRMQALWASRKATQVPVA